MKKKIIRITISVLCMLVLFSVAFSVLYNAETNRNDVLSSNQENSFELFNGKYELYSILAYKKNNKTSYDPLKTILNVTSISADRLF